MKRSLLALVIRLDGSDSDALKNKSVLVAFLKFLGIGVTFLLQIFLARLMGEGQYGVFVYVLNWIYLFVLISKAGMDTALLRFIPQYIVQKEQAQAHGIMLRAFHVVIILSSIITAVMIVMVVLIFDDRAAPHLKMTFLCGAGLIPLITMLRVVLSGIQAFKKVAMAQFPEGIFVPVALILFLSGVKSACDTNITSVLALLSMTAIVLIALSFSIIYLFSVSAFLPYKAPKNYETKTWLRVSMPMMLTSGMLMLLGYLDTIMLGALIQPTVAGVYSVASRIAMFETFLLVALNAAIVPFVSGYYTKNEHHRIQSILTRVTTLATLFGVLYIAVMIVCGVSILNLFSPSFISAFPPMLILLAGYLVNIGSGSVGLMANISDNQDVALCFIAFSALLNVILNFILIPRYQMIGASAATAVSMIVWNVGLAVYLKYKLRIDTSIFSVARRFP